MTYVKRVSIVCFFICLFCLFFILSPQGIIGPGKSFTLTVSKNQSLSLIASALQQEKIIRNQKIFIFLFSLFNDKAVQPGGYYLSSHMALFQVAHKLRNKPDLVWVTVSGCQRKEQIGELLAKQLDWNTQQIDQWNTLYSESQTEYKEGVYYPDTYLLPRNETPKQIAKRFIDHFNEKLQTYFQAFLAANIRWTTGVKIASLLAREAAGPEDAKLISGVIWNRLEKGMLLQIDATMQYTRGKDADGNWWGSIDLSEKKADSPFNTYLYKGLPPTPICSPNIEYIKAVLYPKETSCLFYLHDKNKTIHCSETYEQHVEAIKTYLD